MKRLALKITGRVQGVCYRAEAQSKASALGLKGYAKNNRDGSVTVVAVGESPELEEFIEWCRRGPELAHVENVDVSSSEPFPDENFEGFEIY